MTREHAENIVFSLEHSEIGDANVKDIIRQVMPKLESLTETELIEFVTTKYDRRPTKKELYGDEWF